VQPILRQAEDIKLPFEERKRAYVRVANICSQAPFAYSELTAFLLEHQDAEPALTWARRGLKVAPGDPELTVYEGMALLLLGQPDPALNDLKKAPPSGKNEFYLGLAYRALREHKGSQQAFLKAYSLGFNDPYLFYVLIEQDHALGDKEAGLRDFRTFYEHYPGSPWLHMLYGDAYMAKNDDASAQSEYAQAAKLAPGLPIVEYQLGYLDFTAARYEGAEAHFRKEIATNPTFASAYLYLGATLRRLNHNAEALPFLQQAVKRDPNYPLSYNALATAQLEAGELQEAVETLREGERRFPQDAAFPAQLAGPLRRLGKTQEAARESEKASRLSRKNNPIQHGLPGTPSLPPEEDQQKNEGVPDPPPPPPTNRERGEGILRGGA